MRRALLLACLCALPLVAAPTADARKGMEMAIQDDGVFLKREYYDRERGLQQAQDLGATRLRVNMLWGKAIGPFAAASTTKPANLTYNFAIWDDLVDAAARHGMRVTLTLAGLPTPAFASGHKRQDQYKPNAKRFAEFVSAVAKHFKGRVDTIVLWNEPNHKAWLNPVRSQGTIYRKLYIAGYKAAKKANRRLKVMIAETAPFSRSKKQAQGPLKFLRQLTCTNSRYKRIRRKRCKALVADGYVHHPYEFTKAPNRPPRKFNKRDDAPLGGIKKLTSALTKLKKAKALYTKRKKALDLYLFEYGYFVHRSGPYPAFPESKRAKYIVKGFQIALKNKRIRTMLYYTLAAIPSNNPSSFFDLSIVEGNGNPTPSYTALQKWGRKAKIKRNRGAIRLPARPSGSGGGGAQGNSTNPPPGGGGNGGACVQLLPNLPCP
jgi:hypothetical protein